MNTYALVDPAGLVVNIIVAGPDFEIPSMSLVEVSEGAAIGGTYADGVFTPPPPAPVDLAAYAADKRWQVETGGITINGATIDTSRDSQSMIIGAYAYSQANLAQTIMFKAASGWVTLDAATMAAIATAVGAHVQACFACEAAVQAAITAGTITTTAEIDAADWRG
ncbi:MAG: DUF4376 domain-containing protein [Mesorhizobium sp.]